MEYNSPTRINAILFLKKITYLTKTQDERILKDIRNFLVNFILNILIKCILIKKRVYPVSKDYSVGSRSLKGNETKERAGSSQQIPVFMICARAIT